MPLSPKHQALVAAVGIAVGDNATDDEALDAVIADLKQFEGRIPAMKQAEERVTALSADVTRLEGELTTAKAEAKQAGEQVVTLSADATRKPDPLVADGLAEVAAGKWELAVAAGFPAKAVEAIRPSLRDADGRPNVLALSACPAPDGAGKTKPSRFELALAEWSRKLATGDFGQGVPLGHAKPGTTVVQMSGDGAAGGETDYAKVAAETAGKHVAALYGHHAPEAKAAAK